MARVKVKRRIGSKRDPATGEGLTRTEAEAQPRERVKPESYYTPDGDSAYIRVRSTHRPVRSDEHARGLQDYDARQLIWSGSRSGRRRRCCPWSSAQVGRPFQRAGVADPADTLHPFIRVRDAQAHGSARPAR